jgi:hypothetical protein
MENNEHSNQIKTIGELNTYLKLTRKRRILGHD